VVQLHGVLSQHRARQGYTSMPLLKESSRKSWNLIEIQCNLPSADWWTIRSDDLYPWGHVKRLYVGLQRTREDHLPFTEFSFNNSYKLVLRWHHSKHYTERSVGHCYVGMILKKDGS